MLIPRWTFAFSFAALSSLCTTPALANVLVVRGSSTQTYPTITAAVAASQDGDLLLVSTGTYAGYTLINARSLRIVAIPGQSVVITGQVVIRNLPLRGTVVLEGLTVRRPLTLYAGDPTALRIESCSGNVRLFHCVIEGGEPYTDDPDNSGNIGGSGVYVLVSPRVALAHCTIRGGRGQRNTCDTFCETGRGGRGVESYGSSIVVHDSQVFGGNAGQNLPPYTADYGGWGGAGCAFNGRLFASSVSFQGGNGVHGNNYNGGGGDGLGMGAGALARLRSATLLGGLGGTGGAFPGPNGQPSSGAGTIQTLALPARSVDLVALAGDASTVILSVTGFAGDRVYLEANDRAGFRFSSGTQGAWLLAHPAIMPVVPTPIFTLPGNGMFIVNVPTGSITSFFHSENFLQARVQDSGGSWIESTPLHFVLLNHLALTDCNGNGVLDLLDIAAGASDCDGNFQPDVCQPDCNGNGIPDPCDIAHATSPDLNHNGVPDECEVGQVWVDDSAAPGGNGSMAAPFQTLSQGVSAAPFNGTVNVMDGSYTGPANRNLDFGGKRLVLRGLNGSSSCIVDAQGATGPILRLHSGEPVGTRIEGLTLRGAQLTDNDLSGWGGAAIHVYGANLVVTGCVLVDNHAQSWGGAMFVANGTGFKVRIEDCTFWANSITVSSSDLRRTGGALYFEGHVTVRRNTFKQNTAPYGGAIGNVAYYSYNSMISHCTFFRNIAAIAGGGVFTYRYTNNNDGLWLDDCLLTGNSAGQYGGAAYVSTLPNSLYFPFLYVTNCTIVGNVAQQQGGALALEAGGELIVSNSILWDNTAPQFPAIRQVNPGLYPGSLGVAFSDVQGGQASVGVTGGYSWLVNLDLDPVFVDSDGPDNNPLTFADNDLHLMPGSPCLDAGVGTAAYAYDLNDIDGDGITNELVPLDLDLLPRRVDIPSVPNVDTGIDMGAYEHP